MNAKVLGLEMGLQEIMSPSNIRAYIAEFVGTLLFVLAGAGTVIVTGGQDLVAIAIAHGLGIGMMVYMAGKISGGYLNPWVTLSMIVTGRLKIAPGLLYAAAQIVGGIGAIVILYVVLHNDVGNATNFGAHGVNNAAVGNGGALLIEGILTAMLVLVVFATAVAKDGYGIMAPLAIGLTIALIHFVAVPMTGASVNIARTFGPALVSNHFDSFWIYLIGPAIGATVGGLLYQYVFLKPRGDI